MTEPLDDERLGDLVLRENFLSEEELKVCMEARGASSPARSLQEVMIERDFLTHSQMKRILKKYFSGENSSESTVDRFGEVAIRKGFVTEEQLQECLEEQKAGRQSGRHLRLGQILMQRRLISTQQFLEVLKAQEAHSISCPECGKVAFSGEMESSHGEGFRCASCQAVLDQSEEPPPFPPPPSELPESDVVTLQKPSSLPLREEPTKDASGGGDRYRLIQQVGQNSRTVVHQAYDRSRGEVVLLKVVRKEHFDTPFAEKFLQAARKRKDYVHPAHLSVFDIGIRDGCPYFTMEYEEGRSLEKRIREGEFSPLDVARTMGRIALALGSLHEKGSCHGNIKASNIFFSREEEVRFSDAGAQEDLSDYVSPERVGKPGADVPGDIYALGIVLYQMVTGKLPYVSVPRDMLQKTILSRIPKAPRDLNENIPVDLEAICLRAIEKDPLMRYESVRDLAGDLHRFLEGIPVRSRPGSTVAKMVWGGRRFRRRMIGAVAVLLVLGLVGYYFFEKGGRGDFGGEVLSGEDLRAEAEPSFFQARELSKKTGMTLPSLSILNKALRQEAVHMGSLSHHSEGEKFLSVAKAYQEAALLIQAGGAEREEVRKSLSKVSLYISEVKRNYEALSPSQKKHVRSLEAGEKKVLRLWERVSSWPGEKKKALLSALDLLQEATSRDASYGEAFLLQGTILRRLWRFEEAFVALEKAQALSESSSLPELHFEFGFLLFSQWALFQGDPLVSIDSRGGRLSLLASPKSVGTIALHLRKYLEQGTRLPRENRFLAQSMLEIIGEKVVGQGSGPSGLPEVIFGDKNASPETYRILGFLYQKRGEIRRSHESFYKVLRADFLFSREGLERRSLYPRPALEYLFASLERQSPITSETRYNRVITLLALGDQVGAKSGLEALLKGVPNFIPAWVMMTRMKLAQVGISHKGETPSGKRVRTLCEETLSFCEKSLEATPPDRQLRLLRVEMLLALGRGSDILGEVQDLLLNRPGDPILHYLEACAYLSLGAADRAMRSARSSLQADSSFAKAYEIRARARLGVRDFLGAMEDVNKALTLKPNLVSTLITQARIHAYKPKRSLSSAMESLSRAEKKFPGNPEVWFWKGEILALKVEKNMSQEKERLIQTESLSCYEQAIWVDPKYADAHAMRAVRRLRLGKTKSLDELQNVIKMFPNCGLAYFWQGQFHFGMRRYEDAVQNWEVAEKLLPSHRSMIKEGLRLARSRLKGEEASPKWLKEIQHTQTHVNAGEYDKARTEFEKIVKLLPKKVPKNQAQIQGLVLFSYNYACVLAVHSEKVEPQHQKAFQDKSLYWLEIANRLGWRSWKDQCHSSGNEHMMHDEDLKSLRELPRFKKLLTYSEE